LAGKIKHIYKKPVDFGGFAIAIRRDFYCETHLPRQMTGRVYVTGG
jgi:hypothetical protein